MERIAQNNILIFNKDSREEINIHLLGLGDFSSSKYSRSFQNRYDNVSLLSAFLDGICVVGFFLKTSNMVVIRLFFNNK